MQKQIVFSFQLISCFMKINYSFIAFLLASEIQKKTQKKNNLKRKQEQKSKVCNLKSTEYVHMYVLLTYPSICVKSIVFNVQCTLAHTERESERTHNLNVDSFIWFRCLVSSRLFQIDTKQLKWI